jgi:hypothetical protein
MRQPTIFEGFYSASITKGTSERHPMRFFLQPARDLKLTKRFV